MRIQLTLLNSEKMELEVEKNSVIFGRSSKCDVVIPHESMSRQHCRIDHREGEFFITDLGSSNGVFIEDKKITPHEATPFQTFFTLSFGYVSSCHVAIVVQEKPRYETVEHLVAPTGGRKGPEEKVSAPTRALRFKKPNPLVLNALVFIGILAAIYYFLYMGKKPSAANTLESKPSNSLFSESDLF